MEEAPQPLRMNTVVRSSVDVRIANGHYSVFAAVPIAANDTVLEFVGVEATRPGRHSIQIGQGRHLFAPEFANSRNVSQQTLWQFLCHSCVPNAVVRGRLLVAITNIPAGADVTYDYTTTEWDMSSPFECWCGHASCLGLVRGYRWLSHSERELRRPFAAPHLLEAERRSLYTPATASGP